MNDLSDIPKTHPETYSQEFREEFCRIFGYKLDQLPKGEIPQFKISSKLDLAQLIRYGTRDDWLRIINQGAISLKEVTLVNLYNDITAWITNPDYNEENFIKIPYIYIAGYIMDKFPKPPILNDIVKNAQNNTAATLGKS